MVNANNWLLPEEAYPVDFSLVQRAMLDEKLRTSNFTVPTIPGKYFDKTGSPWQLNDDGTWTDENGDTRSIEWNPILALFGPWASLK